MEDNSQKQKNFAGLYILLTAILVVQLFNIFLDFGRFSPVGATNYREAARTKQPIPDNIKSQYREQLISSFLKSWNNKDIHSLYSLLGKSAQSQVDFEKFKNQCETLFAIGKIENANFVNHEFSFKYLGSDVIKLYYTVSLNSNPGILTFSILNSAEEPQVLRYDIQANP